jgi:hypothetical protein
MGMRIDHLFHWSGHLPAIAGSQHDQFGYLTTLGTLQQREDRLREATDIHHLPMALVAFSNKNLLYGSAAVASTTLTHEHCEFAAGLTDESNPPHYRCWQMRDVLKRPEPQIAVNVGGQRRVAVGHDVAGAKALQKRSYFPSNSPMAPPFCNDWFVCNFVVVGSMLHGEKRRSLIALTMGE